MLLVTELRPVTLLPGAISEEKGPAISMLGLEVTCQHLVKEGNLSRRELFCS